MIILNICPKNNTIFCVPVLSQISRVPMAICQQQLSPETQGSKGVTQGQKGNAAQVYRTQSRLKYRVGKLEYFIALE